MNMDNLVILKETLRQLKNVESTNQQQCMENYVYLFKVRHNLIHMLLCNSFVKPQIEYSEQTLEHLCDNLPEHLRKLTPDLSFIFGNVLFIADVTVQRQSNLASGQKIEKYTELAQFVSASLSLKKFKVMAFSIAVDFSNLEVEFYEFIRTVNSSVEEFGDKTQKLVVDEFDYLTARTLLEEIKSTQQILRKYVDDEQLIEKMMEIEFGKSVYPTKMKDYNVRTGCLGKTFEKYQNGKKVCSQIVQSEDEILDIFEKLLTDKDVHDKVSEVKTTPELIENTYDRLLKLNCSMQEKSPKPSIHTLCVPDFKPIAVPRKMFSAHEQNQIYTILNVFTHHDVGNDSELSFVKELAVKFVDMIEDPVTGQFNKNVFTSNIVDEKKNDSYKEKYNDYRQNCLKNKTPIKSYHMFLKDILEIKNIPSDDKVKAVKQKIIKIPLNLMSPSMKDYWKKSHSGYKTDSKYVQKPSDSTISLTKSILIDNLIDKLTLTDSVDNQSILDEIVYATSNSDSPTLIHLKEIMTQQYSKVYDFLKTTLAFKYSWHQSLICEQLMHFMQLNLPSNTFSLFTAGMPNQIYIVNNSYHNSGKDVGKSFMTAGYTRDPEWLSEVYGKISISPAVVGGEQLYFYATNWRRLTTTKVTFLKDQFYSTITTAMAFLLRRLEEFDEFKTKEVLLAIRHAFSLRVVISLCSNQRVAEMLSDIRYGIMASVSDYSRIDKFISEKFKPPFKSVIEAWIFQRIALFPKLCDTIKNDPNAVKFKQPKFVGTKRTDDSIGGKLSIISIWSGYTCTDLQDFLDDMFLYVHTIKEPSNIHHENIKALQTIIEYQTKYDNLTNNRKTGNLLTFEDYKEFVLDENIIGFSHSILQHSVKDSLSKLKNINWEREWQLQKTEPLGNITSTKSVIPEYKRSIFEPSNLTKAKPTVKKKNTKNIKAIEYQKYLEELLKTQYGLKGVSIKNPVRIKLKDVKTPCAQGVTRIKVHDAVVDFMERFPEIETVYDGALWNLNDNGSKVLADICIKAQYGAKREFYVINLGAKLMARVFEQIFHKFCNHMPNEMISVSGDRKILVMQEKINGILSKKTSDQELYFVNGDCTKWSAAETMECFISMAHAMDGVMPDEMVKFSKDVISAWAHKEIAIPPSLLEKTMLITEKTKYMDSYKITMSSSQNFLQGMWNYSSSFKAVSSTMYTYKLWKKLRPKSTLYIDHLEHSDDYVLMILVKDTDELEEFRKLHRIIMKCHGFNDSIKKTNVQRFLMEFISLCSFNGHMTYPHIKKTKEVGLNVGCTGFRDDMDTASSRVGEAVRVGVPFSSAYFMQKIHYYNVYRAYSLHIGSTNNYQTIQDAMNTPVELFGIPDSHPVFKMLCKGEINNYRLYNFGDHDTKTKIKYLLNKELESIQNDQMGTERSYAEGLRLYHPEYTFDQEGKRIKTIRNGLGLNFEDLNGFWEKHKPYNYIKPKTSKLLLYWLKGMYYRTNFALAYSRMSRAEITLRLSTFVKKACLLLNGLDGLQLSIKSYIVKTNNEIDDVKVHLRSNELCQQLNTPYETLLSKTLMNCDSTVSSIYSFFKSSRLLFEGYHEKDTISNLTPPKLNWLHINNSIDSVFQYVFNFDDFMLDKRSYISISSLEADKKKLQANYKVELNEETPVAIVKSCYNDLVMSKASRNLCMSYSTDNQTLETFIRSQIEFGTSSNVRFKLISPGVTEAINPHTGDLYYKKQQMYTKNELQLLLDDGLLLYGLLKHGYNIPDGDIKMCLNTLKVNYNLTSSMEAGTKMIKTLGELCFQYNMLQLEELGCKAYELKIFAFLKAYLTNNPEDITGLVENYLLYTYSYQSVDERYSKLGFIEKVEFKYMLTKYIAYKSPDNYVLLLTENMYTNNLTNAYLIAQKLFNLITQRVLEDKLTTVSFTNMDTMSPNIKRIMEDSFNTRFYKLYDRDARNFFCLQDIKDFKNKDILPVMLVDRIKHHVKHHRGEKINKPFVIDPSTSSVFIGDQKLFTLPYLSAVQSNVSYVEDDLNIGGLKVNWWLKSDRIRDFIHNEKLQTNKEIFSNITHLDEDLRSIDYKMLERDVDHKLSRFYSEEKEVIKTKSGNQSKKYGESESVMKELQSFLKGHENLTKGVNLDKIGTAREIDNLSTTDLSINTNLNLGLEDFNFSLIADDNTKLTVDNMQLGDPEACKEENSSTEMEINMDQFNLDFKIHETNESDDELLPEQLKIDIDEKDTNSSASSDNYISLSELKDLVPEFIPRETNISNVPQGVNSILSRGHPTFYLIKKSYIEKFELSILTVEEKLKILTKIKTILNHKERVPLYTKLLIYVLAESLIKTFEFSAFTPWKDSWVARNINKQLTLCYLIKDCNDQMTISKALDKGSEECMINNIHHLFIPLPLTRLKGWIDIIKDDIVLEKFVNFKPIKEIYYELFKIPYTITNDIDNLLDEL